MVGDIGLEGEAGDAVAFDFGPGVGHLRDENIHQSDRQAALRQCVRAAASYTASAAGDNRHPHVEFGHGTPPSKKD